MHTRHHRKRRGEVRHAPRPPAWSREGVRGKATSRSVTQTQQLAATIRGAQVFLFILTSSLNSGRKSISLKWEGLVGVGGQSVPLLSSPSREAGHLSLASS